MIIDATNLIVGRFATIAAKKALLGEKVDIVNCEKAIISGRKKEVLAHWQNKRSRGTPAKGPFIPRRSDMFVRRIIRGMLPYKKAKGDEAYKRIMCHIGVPDKFKNENIETIEIANASKLPSLNYVSVGELCKLLGGKQ